MNGGRTALATWGLAAALAGSGCWAQEPAPGKKVGDLVDGALNPPAALAPAPSSPGKVADDVLAAERKAAAERQRDGLLKYQQALAAVQAGRPAEALRLAKKAKELFPDNAEIAAFAAKQQREVSTNRLTSATHARARAYLSSAVVRGQDLIRAGRYGEGQDLLLGVLEAVKLFAEPAQAESFRKGAERELDAYRQAAASGLVAGDHRSEKVPVGIATPENARRILRKAEGRMPLWYAQQKGRLALPVSVDYRRASPAEIFDDIARKAGVTFAIDRPVALSRSHLAQSVDLRLVDFPAETLLDLVCQKAGVEYVLLERAIVVTTPSKAQEYVRKLPQSLQRSWASARSLFPDLNPELFGSAPGPELDTPAPEAALAAERLRFQDATLPAHLASRKALVDSVRNVLK